MSKRPYGTKALRPTGFTVPKMTPHIHSWHFHSAGHGVERLRCDSCGTIQTFEA